MDFDLLISDLEDSENGILYLESHSEIWSVQETSKH